MSQLTPELVTIGGLQFNTRQDDGTLLLLDTFDGWDDSAASTIALTQKPRDHGAWVSEAYLEDLPISITGRVQAPTSALARQWVDQIKAAISLTGFTVSVGEDDGSVRSRLCYRQDAVKSPRDTSSDRPWSAGIVASDPRAYGTQITASTRLPTTIGGFSWPYSYPYSYTGTVITGTIGFTNAGNVPSPVLLRVDGPCTGPIITHISSGAQLVFSTSYTIAAGNWLEIDMQEKTVLENGQESRNGYIDSRGWFQLDPGENTIGFNAAVYDPASLLTAYLTPAWL